MNLLKIISYSTVLATTLIWIIIFITYYFQGTVCVQENNLIVRNIELLLFTFSFMYIFKEAIKKEVKNGEITKGIDR